MEVSSNETEMLWKAVWRDHHSNHEIQCLVWFPESISSLELLTHGGFKKSHRHNDQLFKSINSKTKGKLDKIKPTLGVFHTQLLSLGCFILVSVAPIDLNFSLQLGNNMIFFNDCELKTCSSFSWTSFQIIAQLCTSAKLFKFMK